MQQNRQGMTLKTNKGRLAKWTHDINEWFISLNYEVSEKFLSDGHQINYTHDDQKFTFVYFTTGRIAIKTNNVDKLRCVFLDKIDTILGVTIR